MHGNPRSLMAIAGGGLLLASCTVADLGAPGFERGSTVPGVASERAAPSMPTWLPIDDIVAELEARVARSPEDYVAHAKLARYLLMRAREQESASDIERARVAAEASLAAHAGPENLAAKIALAEAQMAVHDFEPALRTLAEVRAERPDASYVALLEGDSQLALGEYAAARSSYARGATAGADDVATRTRLARLEWLHGNVASALGELERALELASARPHVHAETVAWCHWQIGQLEFARGRYEEAEAAQRAALAVLPRYGRAQTALAAALAARGELELAIELYEAAIADSPDDFGFLAALEDVYSAAGRDEAAHAISQQIRRVATAAEQGPMLHARDLVFYYARTQDTAARAYELARADFAARPDLYAADAVAWTAWHAGDRAAALSHSELALQLGTPDPQLLARAGLLAHFAGQAERARPLLERALELSPRFDPRLAPLVRRALEQTLTLTSAH